MEIFAFGIAKDILKTNKLILETDGNISVKELKIKLMEMFPEFQKLASLKIAVNNEYQEDGFEIKIGDEVALIPPVCGG